MARRAAQHSFRPGPRLRRPCSTDVRLNYHFNLVHGVPDRRVRAEIGCTGRPSQRVAGIRDNRAGHVRAADNARTDDQPLRGAGCWGAGRNRAGGSHTWGSACGRDEGCLARVRKHQAGNARGDGGLWFDPCASRSRDRHAAGNTPRNGFRLPGYSRVDLSFMKMIPVGGSVRTELRIDVFNAFNRVNLGMSGPDCVRRSGQCRSSAGDHRADHNRRRGAAGTYP